MKIGWIGFGNRGIELVNGLIYFGHEVYGYNRTYSKMGIAIENGLIPCQTIEELINKVDVIFTILDSANSVYDLYCKPNGIFANAKKKLRQIVCIDLTTSSAKLARYLAENDYGVEMLDAPFILMNDDQNNEYYNFVVGGNKHIYEKYKKLFNCLGTKSYYGGSSGAGQILKKANEMAVLGSCLGVAETISFLQNRNINLNDFYEIARHGVGNSAFFEKYFHDIKNNIDSYPLSIKQAMNELECVLRENPINSLNNTRIIYGILKKLNPSKNITSMIEFYEEFDYENKISDF